MVTRHEEWYEAKNIPHMQNGNMDRWNNNCNWGRNSNCDVLKGDRNMHTTEGKQFTFVHHGDYSGEIKIINNKSQKMVAEIPFEDIKRLVAEWVRGEWIEAIEGMEDDTLLVGKLP